MPNQKTAIPRKLYKYCPINHRSLNSALNAMAYYSLPTAFNDPLDCNPSIIMNSQEHVMLDLLRKVMEDDGCSTDEYQEEVSRIYYFSEEISSFDNPDDYGAVIARNIAIEVRRRVQLRYSKMGVLSLTEDWNNPLLWSHYAAQHEGICIEYDTSGIDPSEVHSINYDAPRSIYTTDVFSWKCNNCTTSERTVWETYFLAKAPQWAYEKEWRIISATSGLMPTKLNMTAIYFGMKTSVVWMWMLAKTLNQDNDVQLYEVYADHSSFELKRREVEKDELQNLGINRPAFHDLTNFMSPDDIAAMTVGERAARNIDFKR